MPTDKLERIPNERKPETIIPDSNCTREQTFFLQSLVPAQIPIPGGIVYLVGAGPGDPELLALRAAKTLDSADAVAFDHLVGEGILDLACVDAERIYVGKQKNRHILPQQEINALLVRLARQGKHVARLKGGDPFIFGRGGEELEVLAEKEIRYEVVPGITAANGVSCYTGIPLTHHDYAQSCVFTTGHLKDGSMNLDWEDLVHPRRRS
jgi:uroporphyrin-III C-methyltransferase